MKCATDYRLENFILGLRWETLPPEVQERLRGCFTDLLGALVTGSRSETFEAGLKLARTLSLPGDVPVIGSPETFSVDGAAAVMGHASTPTTSTMDTTSSARIRAAKTAPGRRPGAVGGREI